MVWYELILLKPGELTVYCEGPENNAYCELRDHRDGTFTLVVQAQDIGNHELHIKYENQSIPGKTIYHKWHLD